MFGNRSREMFLSVKVRWHEITDDCYSEIIEIQGVIEAVTAIVGKPRRRHCSHTSDLLLGPDGLLCVEVEL